MIISTMVYIIPEINVLFNSIVNGYFHKKHIVRVKNSNFSYSILKLLCEEGYIYGFHRCVEAERYLFVELKYDLSGLGYLTLFRNFQNPKHYNKIISYKELKKNFRISNNYVLSTDEGVMTGARAIARKLGGIYLFTLY